MISLKEYTLKMIKETKISTIYGSWYMTNIKDWANYRNIDRD